MQCNPFTLHIRKLEPEQSKNLIMVTNWGRTKPQLGFTGPNPRVFNSLHLLPEGLMSFELKTKCFLHRLISFWPRIKSSLTWLNGLFYWWYKKCKKRGSKGGDQKLSNSVGVIPLSKRCLKAASGGEREQLAPAECQSIDAEQYVFPLLQVHLMSLLSKWPCFMLPVSTGQCLVPLFQWPCP